MARCCFEPGPAGHSQRIEIIVLRSVLQIRTVFNFYTNTKEYLRETSNQADFSSRVDHNTKYR
jgi:hypothetical protein